MVRPPSGPAELLLELPLAAAATWPSWLAVVAEPMGLVLLMVDSFN
jgi:hypothetical protein